MAFIQDMVLRPSFRRITRRVEEQGILCCFRQTARRCDSAPIFFQKKRFADIAEQYDEITALDPEILTRLIAKIVVGDRIREKGRFMQQVTVYYNFIGNL